MSSKMISYFVVILLVLGFSLESFAARPDRPRRQKPARLDKNEKRQALESQAREYATQMQKYYSDIAQAVNNFKPLDPQILQDIKDISREGRKSAKYLDKKDKANVLVIQAWANYFEGALKKAQQRANRAYATDPTSTDAYASQFIFSSLIGKVPRAVSKSKPSRARPSTELVKGELDFYPIKGVSHMINKRLTGIEKMFETLNFDGEYIGLLIWKLPDISTIKDPNSLKEETMDHVEQLDARAQRLKELEIKVIQEELEAIKNLSSENNAQTKLKFATLIQNDTQSFADALEFAKNLSVDSLVVNKEALEISMPDFKKLESKSEFAAIKKANAPVFVVFDPSGVVKYAGSARGIAPVIIINSLVPNSIKKAQLVESEAKLGNKRSAPVATPKKPKVKAKKISDPNQPQSQTQMPQYVQLSDTDEIKAQNLLTKAKMYRGSHTRLGSSKRVVEACRELISTYPNTKYAQEAKEILRSIPAHQRKRYGLTEQELK